MNRNLDAIKVLFIALIVFFKAAVSAANITITWDASLSDDVAGYAVYYGYRSGEYPTRVDAGNQLSLAFPVASGTNYFFVVTAYSLSGIESFPSREVSYLPDTSSPYIAITSPTGNSTFITTNNFVTLAGVASDNFGITQIIWSNHCNGISGVASGTTNWSASNVSLCNGTNLIAVMARDFDGNVDEVLLTIIRNEPCDTSFTAGAFSGLFANSLSPDRSGFFTLKKGSFDSFTGTINLSGWRRGFSGRFTNGIATVSIARTADAAPLILYLQTEICAQNKMTGMLIDGGQETTLLADRVVFDSRTNPAPYAGKYTLAIFGISEVPKRPEGVGFAAAKVLQSGAIRVQGVLGDGRTFTQSTYLSKTGFWPFYASPYRKTGGLISGWLSFSAQTESDLHGDLVWTKPAIINDPFYPEGFSNSVAAIGSVYFAPTNSNQRILNFSNGTVTLTGGELVQGFAKDVVLATNRIIYVPGIDRLSFQINNNVGSFTGTIQLPGYLTRVRFRGGLLQKKNAGYGLYSGTNQVGQVALESVP